METFLILTALLITMPANAANQDKLTVLNLEAAQKLAAKASQCGRENGWNLSVALVNSEGNLIYFQRGDEAFIGSIEAAMDKAKSSNAFQRPTKAFVDGIAAGRIGLVTLKNVVGVDGGIPIQIAGKHAGAIGVGGATAAQDEQCAKAALE